MVDRAWSACRRYRHVSPPDAITAYPLSRQHNVTAVLNSSIDEGAYKAIKRRESGNRVLPAGVVRLEGTFNASQAVKIVVRRRKVPVDADLSPGTPVTPGTATGASAVPARLDSSADLTASSRSSFDEVPGGAIGMPPSGSSNGNTPARRSPLVESSSTSSLAVPVPSSGASATSGTSGGSSTGTRSGSTEPDTPTLQPAMSLSSSIASLDPLSSRFSVPNSPQPAGHAALAMREIGASLGGVADKLGLTSLTSQVLGDRTEGASADEWEEVEIGKGLALYNSTEMDRLKGQKRSVLCLVYERTGGEGELTGTARTLSRFLATAKASTWWIPSHSGDRQTLAWVVTVRLTFKCIVLHGKLAPRLALGCVLEQILIP
jgi:glutamate 5-kinase